MVCGFLQIMQVPGRAGQEPAQKAPAVDRAGAVLQDRRAVCLCPVSLVSRKAVNRIFEVHLFHIGVPGHLGKDAGGSNRNTSGVSFYDRYLQDVHVRDRYGIIDKNARTDRQPAYCAAHGLIGRLENIDLIDPLRGDHDDCPGDSLFRDLAVQDFSSFFRHFFGVVEPGKDKVFGKDDSGCRDRSCEGTAAGFIDPADRSAAARGADSVPLKRTHLLHALHFRPHSGFPLLSGDLRFCHFFFHGFPLSSEAFLPDFPAL